MLPRNADSLFVNIPQRGSPECMFKQSETWETMRYYILPALLSVLLFCWMLMKCPTLFYTLTEMDVCVLRSVSSPLPAFFSSFFFFEKQTITETARSNPPTLSTCMTFDTFPFRRACLTLTETPVVCPLLCLFWMFMQQKVHSFTCRSWAQAWEKWKGYF